MSLADVAAQPPGDDASSRVFSPTETRILEAALRLFGRRGVKRLGMQEISEAAGVSRGTLYRYFASKDQVVDAAATYDEQKFALGLEQALEGKTSAAERIQTFIAYAFDSIRAHPARTLFDTEPEFVLGYLLYHLPKLRDALLEQLGDALDVVPAVTAGGLSREQLADVIVRLFVSSWIIPESDDRALVQSINHILLTAPEPLTTERT